MYKWMLTLSLIFVFFVCFPTATLLALLWGIFSFQIAMLGLTKIFPPHSRDVSHD
jgi:hypothetical protein